MPFVLIVDDHVDTCRAMLLLTRKLGREARCVHSGEDALAMIRADAPALVLLDISMPGMDGLETLGRIRSMDESARLPVVMLTAMNDPGYRQRASALGADGYLLKAGFSLQKFRDVLAAHVPA
jgi:CheY-like chemotaxis protein